MKVTVILIASSVFLWQMNVFHEDLERGLTVVTEETVLRKDAINPIIAICPKNEYLGQVVRCFRVSHFSVLFNFEFSRSLLQSLTQMQTTHSMPVTNQNLSTTARS